jgi:hypothetical protein
VCEWAQSNVKHALALATWYFDQEGMKNRGGVLGVIFGAALALGACDKPRTEMAFDKLDPDFGGLQGGKTVQVLGRSLRLDIGYAVYFGELQSPQVSIQDEGALLAVTPPRVSPGAVDVTVRADNGSVFVIQQGFEYINEAGSLLGQPEGP